MYVFACVDFEQLLFITKYSSKTYGKRKQEKQENGKQHKHV